MAFLTPGFTCSFTLILLNNLLDDALKQHTLTIPGYIQQKNSILYIALQVTDKNK
jgi:hypothetical protein